MRCLNCNTVVADADPCCLRCGARCTTPVRLQQNRIPIPFVAFTLMIAGFFGYLLTLRPADHPRKVSKEEVLAHKTAAYEWALGGFFLGLGCDVVIIWYNRRRR